MENQNGTRRSKRFAENEICIEFDAISENEGLARVVIAAFISRVDPTLDELEDVKTAVSEAVTNAIIHGYREQGGRVVMRAHLTEENELSVEISDTGVGIADVAQAMQPLYTSAAENERSGLFLHGGLYGPSGGREQYRRGNCCTYVEKLWRRRRAGADFAGSGVEQQRQQGMSYGGEGTFYQGTERRKGCDRTAL